MARGQNFAALYGDSTPNRPCTGNGPLQPIAGLILDRHDIPNEVEGSSLPNYDIKSQDTLTMLRLSLLATTNGSNFKEVYINNEGVAQEVLVGDQPGTIDSRCILKSTSSEYVSKVDHVLLGEADPLPVRLHGGSVNVMGIGVPISFRYNCGVSYFTKNNSLRAEAWAQFQRSAQSETTKRLLKELVRRSSWEQLVEYKMSIPNIPSYASFSPQPNTPKSDSVYFGGIDTTIAVNLGSDEPDSGGVVDISNVNMVSAPVLDMQYGDQLLSSTGASASDAPSYGFTANDIYVMLDNQCYINSLSKGQNWFLLPTNNPTVVNVRIRSSSASTISLQAFGGIRYSSPGTRVYVFRRDTNTLSSMADFVKANQTAGNSLFSVLGGASETLLYGPIYPSLGGNFGVEVFDFQLSYTIQMPSIYIRSPFGDARAIANQVAAQGIVYTAIKIVDEPGAVGYNGTTVLPPAPPDEETESFCPESPIESLQGTIIDMSAPFLNRNTVGEFSANVYNYINSDTGQYEERSYTAGGYTLLPGMTLDGKTIHNVKFSYNDKDSMLTNITLGPKYYQVNSFTDSNYVKRSETITRTARVIRGSNSAGEFVVYVDGLGIYNAINATGSPIYPGDRVEIKINNYPIEP